LENKKRKKRTNVTKIKNVKTFFYIYGMRSRVCGTVERPSVCLPRRSTAAAGLLLSAQGQEILIDCCTARLQQVRRAAGAGAQQQRCRCTMLTIRLHRAANTGSVMSTAVIGS